MLNFIEIGPNPVGSVLATLRQNCANIVAVERNKYYIFQVGVFVALCIQCEMCVCHIVICASLAVLYFSHYFMNGTIFRENLLNIKKMF